MRIILKTILPILCLSVVWGLFLFFGSLEGWWHKPLTHSDHADDFFTEAKNETQKGYVGSLVMALIEDGAIQDEYLYSVDGAINRHTAFQVASLSKWVTAWGVMALVDEGKLALDEPVNHYLTRWQLPQGSFDNDGVTVRRLLSHTAGLTDGLGYAGFAPGTPVQSLEASLTQAADASPGASGAVKVGVKPGSEWIYSGGGYTLLQLLIEEVSGLSFQDYMQATLFKPLGMVNSTFYWDEAQNTNLAKFYDANGKAQAHLRYTSLAATSLYTSLHDMELFVQAHFKGHRGEPKGRGIIKPQTLDQMREPHAYQMGAAIWGLGTMLYAENNGEDFIIGHDGSNEPAINTAVRLDPATGDGIIILEMGNPFLATEMGSEWVFWKTGNVDSLMFISLTGPIVRWFIIGSLIMALLVIVFRISRRKRTDQKAKATEAQA